MAPKKNQKTEVEKANKKKNNASKKPRPVIKTTLDNPFSVNLPVVWEELEKEIKLQLELCSSGLGIPILTPPWREVYALKGEERIRYSQKYKKEALEKVLDNPESASRYEIAKEGRSHLIFGYNAVMRALEQNKLAGILLKKDVTPTFIGETFIPGCLSKNIPLVPLNGLDDILKKEDTLSIKHNIMVLGLKSSVKESSCRFFPLYCCMQKVLVDITDTHLERSCLTADKTNSKQNENRNPGELIVNESSRESKVQRPIPSQITGETCIEQKMTEVTVSDKTNIKQNMRGVTDGKGDTENGGSNLTLQGGTISKYKLTTEEIKSYHLKRVDKSKRVFIPDVKRAKKLDLEGDMICFESSTDKTSLREEHFMNKKRPILEAEKIRESMAEIKPVTFKFGFLSDAVDEKDTNDEEKGVFIPENKEINPVEDRISFGSSEVGIFPNRNKRSSDEAVALKQEKEYHESRKVMNAENVGFEFFIDTVGNQEDVAEDISLIPESKKARILDNPGDIISFESKNTKFSPERSKMDLDKTAASSQLRKNTESGMDTEKKDFKLDLLVDNIADVVENAPKEISESEIVTDKETVFDVSSINLNNEAVKVKKTKKTIATLPYIPAKIRRVKNNPDRKSNKNKL